jgi:hypothetical protein
MDSRISSLGQGMLGLRRSLVFPFLDRHFRSPINLAMGTVVSGLLTRQEIGFALVGNAVALMTAGFA